MKHKHQLLLSRKPFIIGVWLRMNIRRQNVGPPASKLNASSCPSTALNTMPKSVARGGGKPTRNQKALKRIQLSLELPGVRVARNKLEKHHLLRGVFFCAPSKPNRAIQGKRHSVHCVSLDQWIHWRKPKHTVAPDVPSFRRPNSRVE